MAKKFNELPRKMSPERQRRNKAEAKRMLLDTRNPRRRLVFTSEPVSAHRTCDPRPVRVGSRIAAGGCERFGLR